MKWFRRFDKRFLWVFVVALLILFMMDFNTRMSELLSLQTDKKHVAAEVTDLAGTQQALVTQIAYATSQAGVEEWAREEAGMIKDGEIPIVPLAEEGVTPEAKITPTPTVVPVKNWEVWQALFFGE